MFGHSSKLCLKVSKPFKSHLFFVFGIVVRYYTWQVHPKKNVTFAKNVTFQKCSLCGTIQGCVKSVQIRSFFWSVFSRICTEYEYLLRKSPYSVRMRENADQ